MNTPTTICRDCGPVEIAEVQSIMEGSKYIKNNFAEINIKALCPCAVCRISKRIKEPVKYDQA